MTLHEPTAILLVDRAEGHTGRPEVMKNLEKVAEVTVRFFDAFVGRNFTTPSWLIPELYPRLELLYWG
jgi:hypothetical protein